MKTTILKTIALSMIALVIGLNVNASAAKPGKDESIKSYLESKIKYPVDAKEKLVEGYVAVAFHLEQNGTVDIEAINGTNPALVEQVKTQLNSITWSGKKNIGETLYYRIEFKLL